MNKKLIKNATVASYTGVWLDYKKVEKFIKYLSRSELKEYINALKRHESQSTAVIYTPKELDLAQRDMLQSIFQGKKVIFLHDASLMLGLRIIESDNIYEINLKSSLEQIHDYISEEYD